MSTSTLDIRGSRRFLFFTSSSGAPRTNKGRQALTRRIGGRSSTKYYSGISGTTDSNRSDSSLLTRSSSTQTDMRDSEIQTDPWWHQAEGLALLCCRGSHRKLDKAKWIARYRAATSVVSEDQDRDCFSPVSEMSDCNENSASSNTKNDQTSSCPSASFRWSSTKRSIGSGPTYGCRRFLPDPIDLWVETYQKIRQEDEIFEQKMIVKRKRLLGRQRNKVRDVQRNASISLSSADLSTPSYQTSQRSTLNKINSKYLARHHKSLKQIPPDISHQVLEELCQAFSDHNI